MRPPCPLPTSALSNTAALPRGNVPSRGYGPANAQSLQIGLMSRCPGSRDTLRHWRRRGERKTAGIGQQAWELWRRLRHLRSQAACALPICVGDDGINHNITVLLGSAPEQFPLAPLDQAQKSGKSAADRQSAFQGRTLTSRRGSRRASSFP